MKNEFLKRKKAEKTGKKKITNFTRLLADHGRGLFFYTIIIGRLALKHHQVYCKEKVHES